MTRMAWARRAFLFGGVAMGTVLLSAGLVGRARDVKTVDMHDACDRDTFGDFCPGREGVNFDTFLKVLEQTQSIGSWHFAPGTVRLKEGQALQARNSGGETHTFTEVAEFGGGFIDDLNVLTGDVVTAPECIDLPAVFATAVEAGETGPVLDVSPGTHKFECCIHPWMRATVTVR